MMHQRKFWISSVAFILCFVCLAGAMGLGLGSAPMSSLPVCAAEETAQNLALSATVTTDSDWPDPEGFWSSANVTDGHKLYGWPVPVEGGTLGWRSLSSDTRDVNMTLTIDLGKRGTIDKVILYPRGGNAVCFPDDYAIEVSVNGTTWDQVASRTGDTEVVAEGRELTFPATEAQYVRLVVTKLAEEMDGSYWACEMSEIEVWGIPNAEENLALSATLTTDSDWPDPEGFWSAQHMIDGHKLYGWPVPVEGGTLGWRSLSSETREVNMTLTLDLGKKALINRVNLYPRGGAAVCFPDDYAIEVSVNGTTWDQVASRTGDTEVVAEGRELTFPATEAQYVRLVVTKLAEEMDGSYWACEMSEIEVWGTPVVEEPAENLALNATVTTDSEWADLEGFWKAEFINDGHRLYGWPVPVAGGTLGWRSAASEGRDVNIRLTLDLGSVMTIDTVVLSPRGGNAICFPDDYAIEISPDGNTWTQVASKTGDTEIVAEARELSFDATNARYVCLVVTKLSEEVDAGDVYVCEVSEMEIYNKSQTNIPITPNTPDTPDTPNTPNTPTGDMQMESLFAALFLVVTSLAALRMTRRRQSAT